MTTALAEAGADIVSFDRNDPVETRKKVEALGRRFVWKKIDLLTASPDDLSNLINETAKEMGRIDILLNNAGICPREPILDFPVESWQNTLQVDLNAPWFLAQAAARIMVEQGGGKIINLGSLISHQGGLTVPGYAGRQARHFGHYQIPVQ